MSEYLINLAFATPDVDLKELDEFIGCITATEHDLADITVYEKRDSNWIEINQDGSDLQEADLKEC